MSLFLSLNSFAQESAVRYYHAPPSRDSCATGGGCIYDIDNRVTHKDLRVGRIRDKYGGFATAFLISDSCLLTAGHARPGNIFNGKSYVEFDVPYSSYGSDKIILNDSKEIDKYEIKKFSVKGVDRLQNDWAVFRVKRNKISNEYPGEKRGAFELDFNLPKVGSQVDVLGYGAEFSQTDRCDDDKHGVLQRSFGDVIDFSERRLFTLRQFISYNAFTQGGNSGGPVIINKKVVGIHTKGGSYFQQDEAGNVTPHQKNSGMLFYGNKALQRAIKNCKKLQ